MMRRFEKSDWNTLLIRALKNIEQEAQTCSAQHTVTSLLAVWNDFLEAFAHTTAVASLQVANDQNGADWIAKKAFSKWINNFSNSIGLTLVDPVSGDPCTLAVEYASTPESASHSGYVLKSNINKSVAQPWHQDTPLTIVPSIRFRHKIHEVTFPSEYATRTR